MHALIIELFQGLKYYDSNETISRYVFILHTFQKAFDDKNIFIVLVKLEINFLINFLLSCVCLNIMEK